MTASADIAPPAFDGERPSLLFLFPPQWTPQNPHFALTTLAGHLRARGVQVEARDLNIHFYADVLTPKTLSWARDRAALELSYIADRLKIMAMVNDLGEEDLERDGKKAVFINHYIESNPDAWKMVDGYIEDACAVLRDAERFYHPVQFKHAMEIIEDALDIYSLPFWPAQLNFNYFHHPGVPLNLEDILTYVDDDHSNPFRRYFKRVVPSLAAARPDVVGISINAFSQVLPGLTLARLLKQALPEGVHLNVGGNFFTRLIENLQQRPGFFESFCHSVAHGEGERPLAALVDAVHSGAALDQVPNLLFPTQDGQAVKLTATCEPEPLETRGFHDLEGLPLDLYLTPELVLCLEASKGCYWGRCTFCDSFFGVTRDETSVERVVAEMRHVKERWGVRHFEFADECMTPNYMEALADRLIAEELDVSWLCNGRLERTFTADRLQKLYAGGLRMVLWGFETGNRRIMELINKGIDFDGRWQVLRDSAAAGIWNFAYIFFGFPTETEAEAEQTVQAICGNTDIIHSYGRSVFSLGKKSLLKDKAKEFGIVSVLEDDEEFSTNLTFRATGGMDPQASSAFLKVVTDRAAKAYGGSPLWMYLRYREDLHLYVAHHGRDWVRNQHLDSVVVADFENVW